MQTSSGDQVVAGCTKRGNIVLFVVSLGPRGRVIYTPIMRYTPVVAGQQVAAA